MWEYVFSSVTWSIGGGLVGYWMGRTGRTLDRLRRRIEEDPRAR